MKKLSIIFCICTLLLCSLLAGCGSKEPAPAADHKLRVVVTFNAMKEFNSVKIQMAIKDARVSTTGILTSLIKSPATDPIVTPVM